MMKRLNISRPQRMVLPCVNGAQDGNWAQA
jgi:hypothetical protein